MAFKIATIFYR